MFYIVPEKAIDWQAALFILSYYHVSIEVRSNGEEAETTYIEVAALDDEATSGDDGEEDLRCAEMAFQMNWHQNGECPDCEDTCGHLIFNKPINPAF